jgi:hypothetical protein
MRKYNGASPQKPPGLPCTRLAYRDGAAKSGAARYLSILRWSFPNFVSATGDATSGPGVLLHHKRQHHRRCHTDSFNRFPLPISIVVGPANSSIPQQVIDAEIRSRHAYLSFLHPEKVADAVRLFSDVKLWDEVGKELGTTSKEIKTSLVLIVDRRNKIAHEADIDPSYPGQRWPINSALVHGALDTLDAIARAIFKVITV